MAVACAHAYRTRQEHRGPADPCIPNPTASHMAAVTRGPGAQESTGSRIMNNAALLSVVGALVSLSALGTARPMTASGPFAVDGAKTVPADATMLACPAKALAVQMPVNLGRASTFTILAKSG